MHTTYSNVTEKGWIIAPMYLLSVTFKENWFQWSNHSDVKSFDGVNTPKDTVGIRSTETIYYLPQVIVFVQSLQLAKLVFVELHFLKCWPTQRKRVNTNIMNDTYIYFKMCEHTNLFSNSFFRHSLSLFRFSIWFLYSCCCSWYAWYTI